MFTDYRRLSQNCVKGLMAVDEWWYCIPDDIMTETNSSVKPKYFNWLTDIDTFPSIDTEIFLLFADKRRS